MRLILKHNHTLRDIFLGDVFELFKGLSSQRDIRLIMAQSNLTLLIKNVAV